MNIIRSLMPLFLSIIEMVLSTLSGEVDYRQFQQQLASKLDEDTCEFWERIWDEVDARYDLEGVEKIYLMGDGAAWIQCGLNVFPEAEFILDRFYLMKYVRRAVGGLHEQGKALRGALRFGNREKAREIIEELVNLASTKSCKQAILEAWG